jgi:putative cell wall-binding protein
MNHYLESCPFTLNTTRICATNPIDTAIEVSRIGFTNMRPNAVILINKNEAFDGIAATPIVHHPINASILYTDGNSLSKETLNEIQRLSPKGYKGVHVILVGNISKDVSSELRNHGFRTHHIAGHNHYETACIIPSIRGKFKNVIIISGEDYSEGIISGYWSAHHGDPILFVQKNRIPKCTLEAINKMNDINIYVLGSTKTVSKAVENYLSNLDNVKNLERIDGETPYDIAVNFAKYKDPKTEFGWNRNYRDGHSFTFGNLNYPMEIIAGVLFAHMGKHTPPLLIGEDTIPSVVGEYIKSIKPMPPKDMPRPPFMHGFILGSTKKVSYDTQLIIEDILSIDHEMKMGVDHKMMWMDNVNIMKYPDYINQKHCLNHETNENNEEMNYKINRQINHTHKCENLKNNYLTADINEIIN